MIYYNCVVGFSNISILNLISSLIWNSAAQLPNKFLLNYLYVMLLWSMNVMSAVRPITKHQGASFALIRSRLLKQTRLKMMLVWWFRIKPRLSIWLGPSQLLIHKSNHPPIWLPLNWKLPVYKKRKRLMVFTTMGYYWKRKENFPKKYLILTFAFQKKLHAIIIRISYKLGFGKKNSSNCKNT